MKSSGIVWQGRAHIDRGWAAFIGTTGDNRPHAHHALQVVVALTGPITLLTPTGQLQVDTAAVVPSDVVHALAPSVAPVGLLYVDAESVYARAFDRVDSSIQTPQKADMARLRHALMQAAQGHRSGFDAAMAELTTAHTPRMEDHRVHEVLDRLIARADLNISVHDIAPWAHLSPSRFAHRFRAHTGMPVRPFLRWLRLQRAATAITAGQSVTDAAHVAGFADTAHLTRTFQRHFGINPRVLGALARR